MSNRELYPKTVEDLLKKLDVLIEKEESISKKNNIAKWIEWFKSMKYNLSYKCLDNEFLKIYNDGDGRYALQLWEHGEEVDVIKYDLLSNYYSEYGTDTSYVIAEDCSFNVK